VSRTDFDGDWVRWVSGSGGRLTAAGHEVSALDQDQALEGLDDEEVLASAAAEGRILVTHNIPDFPTIAREWATAERSPTGVILVYGIDREFELIVRAIKRCLDLYPDAASWVDLTMIVDRKFASD